VGDPTSEEATAHIINVWDTGIVYQVRVTCMQVVDNRASIGGEIMASDVFPGHVGSGLVLTVVDNPEYELLLGRLPFDPCWTRARTGHLDLPSRYSSCVAEMPEG